MTPTPATAPVQVVLCLPILHGLTGRQVLLGLKQRGFGAGHVVAPGGKIEPGESPAQAAARELHEETSVLTDPATLEPVARVYFRFPANPQADMDCQVFMTSEFSGMAEPSDELIPGWYPIGHLPLSQMWEDSPLWLNRLFSGERFDALVRLGDDNESVAHFATLDWPAGQLPDTAAMESDFPASS